MPTPTPERKPLSLPQKALRKMGLLRPVDLALHLPMRYEDETQLVKLADSRDGEMIQIEAVVKSCQVVFKPRRQLQAVVDDGSDTCTLRFFNFYPNMQKALEVGRQVRLRGEVRGGFMGRTMMHPTVQAARRLVFTRNFSRGFCHGNRLIRSSGERLAIRWPRWRCARRRWLHSG
jgi:ATP-dependent DNA helicase RecG